MPLDGGLQNKGKKKSTKISSNFTVLHQKGERGVKSSLGCDSSTLRHTDLSSFLSRIGPRAQRPAADVYNSVF